MADGEGLRVRPQNKAGIDIDKKQDRWIDVREDCRRIQNIDSTLHLPQVPRGPHV